jgi:hypothetical protein
MTEQEVLVYAKYVAVGNGTLTNAMNNRLLGGDRRLAIDIMKGRIAELQSGAVQGLGRTVTDEDLQTMVDSVREAIAVLEK